MGKGPFKAFILAFLAVLVFAGCADHAAGPAPVKNTTASTQSAGPVLVKAKLVNLTGGEYIPSAGYYEGRLDLTDTATGKVYPIFVCSRNWDWVKNDSCYEFSPEVVDANIDLHQYSMELSGCFVGNLNPVAC